ncbi:uncharacterized protein LOC130623117 [Hydractinia symbiolongicarpus]|uniref:uncharacterized protein LOC130623117 n=1 Tax=Hydractinia symbiolongicarpus TaxID=13093 RepID=UPI0025509A7C|nr:uncharacterized protein LOC130623117 [Hydractinia symbiolongicarpus]
MLQEKNKGHRRNNIRSRTPTLSFTGVTDSLGVPLLNENMINIWTEEKRHVKSLCTWKSSLESFHNHLAKFIPGTSANAVNFQAYLLDGLMRWNVLRKDAVNVDKERLRSFDSELVYHLNHIYIGSWLLLINQPFNNDVISCNINDGVVVDDAGYESLDERDVLNDLVPTEITVQEIENEETSVDVLGDSTDSRGIPGWHKVDALATYLLSIDGLSITTAASNEIIRLYNQLDRYDKAPIH